MKYRHSIPLLATTLLLPTPLLAQQQSGNCINFSGSSGYTWAVTGGDSGVVGDGKSACLGGGTQSLVIGLPGAPPGQSGGTRIECNIAGTSVNGEMNCNTSLVDGFSAAVTCSASAGAAGFPIGCPFNLKNDPSCGPGGSQGMQCTDCCINTDKTGNGVFQHCAGQPGTFISPTGGAPVSLNPENWPLNCEVGGGSAPMLKREDVVGSVHMGAHRTRRMGRAAHRRALGNVLAGVSA